MKRLKRCGRSGLSLLTVLCMVVLCGMFLSSCDVSAGLASSSQSVVCRSACALGSGASGVNVLVEPDAGISPLLAAINGAVKSVWLEIYLLTNKRVIQALEGDANRGVDVRVMLEPHPAGGANTAVQETLDRLNAARVQARASAPQFALTHEKGMLVDASTVYIMTSNFTNAALGVGTGTHNREYDIVDTNASEVQAVTAIFQADWERSSASFSAVNLVVSPINARFAFTSLLDSARRTLLLEAEEMNDSSIEQALVAARQRGVRVQVVLPAPSGSFESNQQEIAVLQAGGVLVREDYHLYMHAKLIIVDGREAFVGSENISPQSLDQSSRRRNH